MSKVALVKEAVKETLVGTEEPVQLSTQTKARFNRHAVKDPESGELFLGPEQFINAVAPPEEDYVSQLNRSHHFDSLREL
jgi:solute carrier family 25 aspartate/glutamate transporter 12/13